MIFRDTGSPAVEVHGTTLIVSGGTLAYDATGIPQLTISGGPGGGISGTGTTGKITKWTSGGVSIGDSIISESGSVLTIPGSITGLTTLSMSGQLTSTLATGTAPFVVASTTKVTNLNADTLDGIDSTGFLQTSAISGTAGTLVKYATSSTLGNSIVSESGSTLTINNTLVIGTDPTGAQTLRVGGDVRVVGAGTQAAPSLIRIEGTNGTTAGDAWVYFGQILGGSDVMLGLTGTDSRSDGRQANDGYLDVTQSLQLRAKINGTTFSNAISVGSVSTGGIYFYTAAQSAAATLRWTIDASGNFIAGTDNSWDIGASGATRPRTGYFGTDLNVGSKITVADNNTTSTFQSGNMTIGGTSITGTSMNLILASEAGKNRQLLWRTGANARWMIRANSTAEGGSNAGSNFEVLRFDDAGTLINTSLGINRATGLATFGNDVAIGTLGTIDSAATPIKDYSLVYNGTKWTPVLINASIATSGTVSAGSLPDGTTAAWVNTQPTLSGAPGTPTTTGPTYTLGYRCIIVKMGGASANQMYAVDMTSNGTFYSARFSITTGTAIVTVTGGTPNTFVSTDVGRYIDIAGAGPAGTNGVLHAKIITFTSATQVTVDTNATNTVSSANGMIGSFMGFDQRSCTTGSTTTNIVFTAPGWSINQWKGYQVVCNSASGGSAGNVGQVRTVLSNTTTALVFDSSTPWPAAPLSTDQFTIAPVLTTADTFVHAGLQDAAVMWYRFRVVGGASTYISTDYGPNTVQTAGTTVSSVSYVNAFGLVVASQLAVTNLSAISGAMSALTVGSGTSGTISAGSIAVTQFQSAATRTAITGTINRVYTSGGNFQLNTGGSPEVNNILLGDHSVTVGTPPVTKTNVTEGSGSYTNNATDTVSVGAPNAPAWASSTSLATLTTAISTSLPAIDTNYTVFGQMVTSTTTTSGTVTGFSSCNTRARVEYQTSSGGAWTDAGEVCTDNINPGGSTSTLNWSTGISIAGTPTALNFRIVYEISLSCTKVLSGTFTCSGGAAAFPTVGVQWLFSAGGTVFTRRGLKLYNITSKPHITYVPLSAALTTSNSIEGESWYTASTIHALQINDGTQIVNLGAATTTQEGVIKLAKHLGGTYLLPTVIALNASGTDVNVGSAAAPAQFQVLRANSSTAATWQDIPGTPSAYPHLRTPFGWYAPGTGTVQIIDGLPATPTVSGGALSAQVDRYYTAYTSGAIAGNQAGVVTTTFTITRMNFNPILYMRIRTAAAANSLRAWMGFTSVSQTANSDTATGSVAMFRLNGLTLVGVCRDGTTQQVTGTLATLANSTSYLLKIRVTGTNTIAFSVDGGAETTLSTNVPAATTGLGIQLNTTATIASATTINVAYVQGEHGR